MRNQWDDREAERYGGLLGQRVYTSQLLGRDPSLVLHGGGNTSVKLRQRSILGEEEDILYVKGSGWDLATVEEEGFSPVRMDRLLGLARVNELSDIRMAAELAGSMTDPSAPDPSVEAILHAILPYRYVDHTHADALISITNTPHGEQHVRAAFGDDVAIVPYVMPGFKLARLCADLFPRQVGPNTIGMVLMNHGLVSFGETARESYERMIELVERAERYLRAHNAWELPAPRPRPASVSRDRLAKLRQEVSAVFGAPAILKSNHEPHSLQFAQREDVAALSQQGPATPDHVIRTKCLPMLGTDVAAYAREYERYFRENAQRAEGLMMLDGAPRVILDGELGLLTAGRTVKDASIAEAVYRHTMEIIQRASLLEEYRALPAADIFDVEYWDLEQAKLRRGPSSGHFAGEVALVTGAASGIGRACVQAFLAEGAAVVALDVNVAIGDMFGRRDVLGLVCDVTDSAALEGALDRAALEFGGLDMLVLNAGIFPASRPIGELPLELWRRVHEVNLDANLALMRLAHPLLCRAPAGGRLVVIGSKNVPAPGPGAAAYSAAKAALTQLARVAALEWGKDRIRVNVLHPNAVFDTGIWTEEVLETRARSYGLSVEEYKRNNVLGVEVTSADVARLAAALCGPLFAKTTGAQIPVDGGNERVI